MNEYSDGVIVDFQQWCAKIVDDILIWAENLNDLEERVRKVLTKCRELGITISKKKLAIGKRVKFAGYIVSSAYSGSINIVCDVVMSSQEVVARGPPDDPAIKVSWCFVNKLS